MLDFELRFLKRVRFRGKRNSLKVSPKSNTKSFHNVFFHETKYNNSLEYLGQLDISIRHHSINFFCTPFPKDFDIRFLCLVPICSLDKPNTCRN